MKPKMILGLVGSPRKLGNCEVMTKAIANRIPGEYSLKLIRMPSLSIDPCIACYGCIAGKKCPNEDDMDYLLDRITEADALIISSPVYYLGAHSIFKRILDRGFLFFKVLEKTYGKPCILLNFFGNKERIGVAPQTLRCFAAYLGLDIRASVNLEAALPGEIIMNENTGRNAAELAERLFLEKVSSMHSDNGCPYCGCEIVRMAGKQFICTVCNGTFRIDADQTIVPLEDGGALGDAAHLLLHRDWLRGMKDRFMSNRKEIVRITLPYKEIGEWIEPKRCGAAKTD